MNRSVAVLAVALVGCVGASPDPGAIFEGTAGRWVDLSYSFSEETIYWPTAEPFVLEQVFYGVADSGFFYAANNFSAAEHGGTHLDAPIHFAEGRHTTDEIPLEQLIGPAVVIDVSGNITPDYQIGIADIGSWEASNGGIPDGAILLFRTGWGERWPDRLEYLGTEERGPDAVADLHFPGIAPATAQWLVDERDIDAIGIDTPSIDYGQSTRFESHQILYGADIPGFENVANLDWLPETGSFVIALPMKIAGGSGAPLRIVAFIPE